MRYQEFSNGDKMPMFGLGTWKSETGKVKQAVIDALKTDYRHIDCAAIYGNEKEVGEGIKECVDNGVVKREDLWITSKLWNDAHKKEDVQPALEKTLKDLQLNYLDLYLMHWPIALKPGTPFPRSADDFLPLEDMPLLETWNAMAETVQKGLTHHIGVANFSDHKLMKLIEESDHHPEMNQVELHPYLQQDALVQFCKENKIPLTAYSPLGSMDRPDMMKRDNEPILLENNTIKTIAKENNCTPGQVLIAWALERNTIVIPKSTNSERIAENFKAQEVNLTSDQMKRIQKLDKGFRYVDGAAFDMEGNSYSQSDIWDEQSENQPIS